MDPLLDTELRDIYVEGGVQDVDDLGLADDRTIALSEIVDQDTQEQVSRLLLCELRGVLLTVKRCKVSTSRDLKRNNVHVALLRDLGDSITVHGELRLSAGSGLKDSVELAVDEDVGIAADGRGEVRVQRHVKCVVTVLRDVEHARAEVLRALSGLEQQDVHNVASSRLGDGVEATHEST